MFENNKGCQNIFHNKLLRTAHVQDQHSFLPSWCTSCYQDIIWLLRYHYSLCGSLPSQDGLKHCPSLSLHLLACTVSCISQVAAFGKWRISHVGVTSDPKVINYPKTKSGEGRIALMYIMPLGRLWKTTSHNSPTLLHTHMVTCAGCKGMGDFHFCWTQQQDRKKKNLICTLSLRMADSFPLPPISGLGYKLWNRDPEALYFWLSFYALVNLLSSSFPLATITPPPHLLIGDIKRETNKKSSKTHNGVRCPCFLP